MPRIQGLLPLKTDLGFRSGTSYDLNLAILTHCTGGDLHRISCMKRFGAVHAGTYNIHLTLLVNPGDAIYTEELISGWSPELDISILEMPSRHPIPKINGYYLWLMQSGPSARWHGRVDDDSITDLAAALDYLDRHFADEPVHVATGPMSRQEITPLFVPYLLEKGIFLDSTATEYESSFTSLAGMKKIISHPQAREMIVDTALRFQAPGDRALAFAAHLSDVPVIENPFSDYRFMPERLTLLGGEHHHVHYVPWQNRECIELLSAFLTDADQDIEETGLPPILDRPLRYYTGGREVLVVTLSSDGDTIGAEEKEVTNWKFTNGELILINSSGRTVASFSRCSSGGEPVFRGAENGHGRPQILRISESFARSQRPGEITHPSSVFLQGIYCRLGYDLRPLCLENDGTISQGQAAMERSWSYNGQDRQSLLIEGDKGITCTLKRAEDGIWRGRWLLAEKMPVAFIPRNFQDHLPEITTS